MRPRGPAASASAAAAPEPARRGRRARAAIVVGAALLCAAALSGRMLLGARGELAAATAAAGRGDHDGEVRHLRRAMACYLPGSPWVRRAHDGLLLAAAAAEARGERAAALGALHELRSAILALRGLTRPYAETLPGLSRRIAALSARDPEAAAALRTPAGAEALRARLDQPPEPRPLWAGLALVGFLGWVGGAALLLARGLRPDGSRVRGRFALLCGVVALGLALFGVGLALA